MISAPLMLPVTTKQSAYLFGSPCITRKNVCIFRWHLFPDRL